MKIILTFGLLWVAFILLFIAKLVAFPGLSWWWVTFPLWSGALLLGVLVALAMILEKLADFIEARR